MSDANRTSLDLVALLTKRWRTMMLLCVVGAGAGFAYASLAPKWYSATLTVVQSERSQDSAMASFAAKLPVALDSMSTDVHRIQAVLRSNSVTDAVIDRFNLRDRYGTEHREHARMTLWQHCSTSLERKAGVVALTCEDQDPKTARDIAAYFGEVGNQVFGRVSASSAREERKFLESQVQKAKVDVDEGSRKLREFQEKHKVIDLPEQTKAVISAMASLQGELVSKELELKYLSGFSAQGEANVVQLRQQIDIMNAKLRDLERQNGVATTTAKGSNDQGKFFPEAMNVPALRFELEQLLRNQKIQETVYFLLMQRYETAKVNEARDTSTFQILDHPTTPSYRTRPKRLRWLVLGGIVGFLAATMLIAVPAWWRRRVAS